MNCARRATKGKAMSPSGLWTNITGLLSETRSGAQLGGILFRLFPFTFDVNEVVLARKIEMAGALN